MSRTPALAALLCIVGLARCDSPAADGTLTPDAGPGDAWLGDTVQDALVNDALQTDDATAPTDAGPEPVDAPALPDVAPTDANPVPDTLTGMDAPDVPEDAGEVDATGADASPWLPTEPNGCNGYEVLCARPYDKVSYATTHNAMSSEEDGFAPPNQKSNVTHQLEDGVRALMLDVHPDVDGPALCHGYCVLGSRPLADGLADIRAFLDAHPREVVSIIFESYVDAGDVAAAFEESGLLPYARSQAVGAPWPTLQELIDGGDRLVVFTDHQGGALPWYLDVWDFAFETHFHYESVEELSCAPNRGSPDSSLFILNHFLTSPVALPELAEQINHNPLFLDRALLCQAEDERLPNFVTVDFYEIGDLFDVVSSLNGIGQIGAP